MTRSPKLSYRDYRAACNEAFTAKISNPTVFYNPNGGFYVAPSRDLVPNNDTVIGLAYYSANTGNRSLRGSRSEYRPIARAVREFFSPAFNPIREYPAPATLYCEGTVNGEPCPEFSNGDKCTHCGYENQIVTVRKRMILRSLIDQYETQADANA